MHDVAAGLVSLASRVSDGNPRPPCLAGGCCLHPRRTARRGWPGSRTLAGTTPTGTLVRQHAPDR
jgi:hypothetical protein